MTRSNTNQDLIATIMDRLSADFDHQKLADLKESVRRDLHNLLNTRWRCQCWPPNYEQLDRSMINYGLPDFTGIDMGNSDNREEFRRIMLRTIQRCEPRFRNVKVSLDNRESFDRTLRFRIEALLIAKPSPELVVYDTVLQPTNAEIRVQRAVR